MTDYKSYKYTEEHEWVKKDGANYYIGISLHAQDELGDIVFVEVPEIDDTIEKGDSFGSVESVKTVSELYAPVGGTVVSVNELLEDEPETLNQDPYDKGWICALTDVDEAAYNALLTYEQYEAFIKEG